MKISEAFVQRVIESLLAESKKDKHGDRDKGARAEPDRDDRRVNVLQRHEWPRHLGSKSKVRKITSFDDLMRWASDMELRIAKNAKGHHEIRDPYTDLKLCTFPSTASDSARGHMNARAELRKSLQATGWPGDDVPE
jgi:hypothetical protein